MERNSLKIARLAGSLGNRNPAVKAWLHFTCAKLGCELQIHPYVWTLRKQNRVMRLAPRQFTAVPHFAQRFDAYFETFVPETKGAETLLDFSRVHLDTYRKSALAFEFAAAPDEEEILDAWFEWYRPATEDLVFDIGAGCGVSTYILSRFANRVIAFEPDGLSFAILQRNIDRHELKNITLHKPQPDLAANFARYGVPAYCKIDLNGAELKLLEAARPLLSKSPIHLAIRTTHQQKIETLLRTCGFQTASHPTQDLTYARPHQKVDGGSLILNPPSTRP
jgi:protein-L-isoaspartate O-methyltransferase